MSKNFKDWLLIVITSIFLFTVIWRYFGFEVAKTIFNVSNYPALIITGAIALVLGVKRSRWSGLFGIVAIILFITGL